MLWRSEAAAAKKCLAEICHYNVLGTGASEDTVHKEGKKMSQLNAKRVT